MSKIKITIGKASPSMAIKFMAVGVLFIDRDGDLCQKDDESGFQVLTSGIRILSDDFDALEDKGEPLVAGTVVTLEVVS